MHQNTRIKTLNSEICNRWRVQSDRANRAPHHLSFDEIVPERYQNCFNDTQQSFVVDVVPDVLVECETRRSACHSTLGPPAKSPLMCLNTQITLKGGYPTLHQNTQSFYQK